MPWQLIYTSAPRGLLSGQSGFCTVARSADVREALAQRLEQISSYHYLRVAEAATASRNPTISAFRLLDLRGAKYYILTRIQPCGLDFTARTNHLAHHLVFQPDELAALPSPAAILRYWPGWMASWQGDPRLLEQVSPAAFAPAVKNHLPAQTWAGLTGDGGRAAGLLESECVRGCYLVCPAGSEEQVLQMYCETLQLLNFNGQYPLRPWRHTFTAFLQAEDNPNDFQWRACQENTPAHKQALTRSAPTLALRSVRAPANSLAKLAREEPRRSPPPPPSAAPTPDAMSQKPSLLLRRESSSRAIRAAPPVIAGATWKQPPSKAKFWNVNLTANWMTLARLGIFAAVLVVLVAIKHHAGHQAPPVIPRPPPVLRAVAQAAPQPGIAQSTEARRPQAPMAAAPDGNPPILLAGAGQTFILAVQNMGDFDLPINNITPFQRLLRSYDRVDNDALPSNIKLTVNTNRWDFPPGAPMEVIAQHHQIFSASDTELGEMEFDYGNWLASRDGPPLKVHSGSGQLFKAFSMHFGFASRNQDPFRLIIVNEKNPPPPLRVPRQYLQDALRNPQPSQNAAIRLLPGFELLDGWQWQLQPLVRSRYFYKDWPSDDKPAPDDELRLDILRRDWRGREQQCQKELAALGRPLGSSQQKPPASRAGANRFPALSEPLSLPLGPMLGVTNTGLASFPAFCQGSVGNLTQHKFAEYLRQLRDSAPESSGIKNWRAVDPEEPRDVVSKFGKLYDGWTKKSPGDEAKLTVAAGDGAEKTNFFMAAWRRLKDVELALDQLSRAQDRLGKLDQGYVALCIVDSVDAKQPRPGMEIIRFDGE